MFQIDDVVSPSIKGLSIYRHNDFGQGWGKVVQADELWDFDCQVMWEGGGTYLYNNGDLVLTNLSLENE